MDKLKKEFASKLLKVKAIKLQPNDPFTWASGWKSPFYCDNRKTLSFPELRNYVKLELVHAILEQFPEADAVAGVATGAIAQGALVADELNMPFVYVRSTPKDHGMQNLIEGQLDPKEMCIRDRRRVGYKKKGPSHLCKSLPSCTFSSDSSLIGLYLIIIIYFFYELIQMCIRDSYITIIWMVLCRKCRLISPVSPIDLPTRTRRTSKRSFISFLI